MKEPFDFYQQENSVTAELQEKETIDRINQMDHYSMCELWRNAPSGHPYFDSTKPFADVFKKRLFDHFGGFTPAISKKVGWD